MVTLASRARALAALAVLALSACHAGVGVVRGGGDGQGWDRPDDLPGHAQRLATGHEDAYTSTALQ